MSQFLRFFPSQCDRPPELKTLSWPDEVRPYYGNYICTQGEPLWAAGLDVKVLYIRGLLSQRAPPNGVGMEAFQPRPPEEARRALAWNPRGKIALFLGDPNDRGSSPRPEMRQVSQIAANACLEIGFGYEPSQVPA
jgi:hypothetical protein